VQPRAACPNEFRWCADSFLLKLSSRGELLFATYLGFGNSEGVPRLAVTDGAIYLAGTARARLDSKGNVEPGSVAGGYHAFVARLKADASAYEYVTYIESNGTGFVAALTVDAERHVYVAGGGQSGCAFKSTPGAFTTPHGCLFVAKLAGEDGSVDWLSRFGGTDSGEVNEIPSTYITDLAIDARANVYITGATSSLDFPTTRNAAQPSLRSIRAGGFAYEAHDAFVTKLTADGTTLSYSTFLGGSSSDSPTQLALDPAGEVHVVGLTESEDLGGRTYTINRAPDELLCCWDAFAVTLAADGSAFRNVQVFGGSFSDGALAVTLSAQGAIWIGGYTFSPDFPATTGVTHSGRRDADGVIAKLAWK